jgi:hypoxanthine phosphoribosyltransferase
MKSKDVPRIFVPRATITSTVARLAGEISRDYHDKAPLLIGILKGSFVFMADLVRELDFLLEVDFIRLSSYGRGTRTSGNVRVMQGLSSVVKDRHVLVVEDIIDTGITMTFLLNYLKNKRPASLALCVLLDKPSRRRVSLTIDYLGIIVPDKFLVGYGLDFDEKYRNLSDICVLEEDN